MVTKQLKDYIKLCRARKIPDKSIEAILKEQGWFQEDIDKAMVRFLIFKTLPSWISILTIAVLIIAVGLTTWGAIFMLNDIRKISEEITELAKDVKKPEKQTGFCGWSTNGQCSSDEDCMTGGCSGQVCQSKDEEPVITTCEYRDCYNAQTYGVSCQCLDNKCQWAE